MSVALGWGNFLWNRGHLHPDGCRMPAIQLWNNPGKSGSNLLKLPSGQQTVCDIENGSVEIVDDYPLIAWWIFASFFVCLTEGIVFQPLWKTMKVSWDDYSHYMESHKIHVPNHQPVIVDVSLQFALDLTSPLCPVHEDLRNGDGDHIRPYPRGHIRPYPTIRGRTWNRFFFQPPPGDNNNNVQLE